MISEIIKWFRNKQETSLESHYQQHVQMSRLERQRKRAERRRQQQLQRDKSMHVRRQQLGRNLQIAFMQLQAAPDAQRLLSWSNQCKELPLSFRRRTFGRFQQLLGEQIQRWLRSGVDRDRLEEDLRAIVHNLGVAKFEADYMVAAMDPQRRDQPENESEAFAGQLTEIQSEHRRRIQTIDAMENLEADVKEELIEAEQQRYRSQLFG